MSIHHVFSVSYVNLRSQNFVFNASISCHARFKAKKKIESAHVLKLSKLINLRPHYQNRRDMRFLQAGQLCFNNDVFSYAMVLVIIIFIKNKNKLYLGYCYVCLHNRI